VKKTLKIAHVKQREGKNQGGGYELHSLEAHLNKVGILDNASPGPRVGSGLKQAAGKLSVRQGAASPDLRVGSGLKL
jgi:hypothetical protein